MFEDFSAQDQETLLNAEGTDGVINNRGAAMTAFARMRFTAMEDAERQGLRSQLLQYCELDTFSMVLIWEAWREWFGQWPASSLPKQHPNKKRHWK